MTPLLPAFTSARFADITQARDRVYCADALDLLRALPDASVDAFIFDPPYNIGLDSWDRFEHIAEFVAEAKRVLKDDTFLAFTITAPHDMRWRLALEKHKFKFVDHVSWVKRNLGAYAAGLNRTHESIYIYRKGHPRYVETRGRYSDVKVPGLLFDVASVEGLQRYIDELWAKLHGKDPVKPRGRPHVAHSRRLQPSMRCVETVNFTNVWSFLPENQHAAGKGFDHASVKPLLFFERLVGLLTSPGAIICDPFVGSGTTAVAAYKLQRHFIVSDLLHENCDIARRRLAQPYDVLLPLFGEAI